MAKKKKIKGTKKIKPKKMVAKPKKMVAPKSKSKSNPSKKNTSTFILKKKIEVRRRPVETIEFISHTPDRYLDLFSRGVFGKSVKSHKGKTFNQKYGSEILNNEFGQFHLIQSEHGYFPPDVNHQLISEKLLHNLKAIPGIAELTEINLKKEGYKTIKDLTGHFKYSSHATLFLQNIDQRNGHGLYEQLNARFSSTNPALLYNSTYFNLSEVAFLDIETLGLHDCPLFLIGVASVEDNYIKTSQIFIDSPLHEKAALYHLSEYLKNKKAVFTFNGKSFDVPFLRKRYERHDLQETINLPHFDIKFLSQLPLKNLVFDFRLQTLERELLNFKRKDDVPSHLVPKFYESFLQSNNIGAVVPIIEHNKRDLITTIGIYDKLHETILN